MNLTSIKEIIPLMERHGFNFSKSLGQNFLINSEVPRKIVEKSGITEDSCVIEIGPGIGCLTKELALVSKKVIAIEIDKKLLPVLNETLSEFDNIEIINGDVMDIDLGKLIEEKGLENISVCANLPYYITTPIIMKLLESKLPLKSITVMVQKEVARRFCAPAGSSDYGAITPVLQYYTKITSLFTVSPGNFMPKPKVDSEVIRLDLISPPVNVKSEKTLFRVIKSAFAMRRKTLENNLQKDFSISKDKLSELLLSLGFPEKVRGEKLTLEDFAKIADKLSEA